LVASPALMNLDLSMAFFTGSKQISEDPRVQICDGVLYFDGSTNQLIALIIQDAIDAVQKKRLEDLGKG
jgi:hypothetical protein